MQFQYEAIDRKTGKKKKGKVTMGSRAEAIEQLKQQGLAIVNVLEIKPSIWKKDLNIYIGKPVKTKDFVVFCRQLATLLHSGVTVVDSLRLLSDQAKVKPFKEALEKIYKDVRSGVSFSDACAAYPKIFDKVFVNMIRAGEQSGNMDAVLERLATFFEKEHNTTEKVKSALTYPIVVSIIATIVVTFLLTNVIPKFINTLVASGGEIPLPTAIVLAISEFLIGYWYIPLGGIILTLISFSYIKKTDKGRYVIDYVLLKLPIFGPLIQKSAIARMTRTLSSLFASAVPILQSLTMVAEIVNNEVIARVLRESRESLRSGDTLSEPLEKSWIFPKLVTHMISIGEQTGQLDTMLEKIADFYEQDVDHMASRLSAIIEPVMIVILAVIVGTIVLAAMLPMFEIYQNV